ncbi:MAG: hypothetical protein HYT11_03890 [Candidatus Levybacteria bacterium]|nr:hypothetical protein [Candidatus Levybacteria bacterium]
MKKLIIITLFLFSLTGAIATIPFVYGASPTPVKSTPTPSPKESLTEKISQLKDRIASRVTELKLVEKKGVVGTVEDVSETKIKLIDVKGTTQLIDVDEITKFASQAAGTKETTDISDIKKGVTISVLGLYNKDSKRILARFISIVPLPSFAKGTISDIDKKNFTITVKTDKEEILVDIENKTKLLQVSPEGEIIRYTFSKLLQDDIVYIVSYPDKKEENRFSALRVLVLSDLLPTPEPTSKKSITPTVSKLTPTPTKSAPTTTLKPTKTPTPTE